MKFLKTEEDRDKANFALQVFAAFAIVGLNLYVVIAVSNDWLEADSVVVGALLTQLGILVGFCFPNSIGDARKNETIQKLVEKAPPPTVPPEELTYGSASNQNGTAKDSSGSASYHQATGTAAGSGASNTNQTPDRTPWE